jgi:hypothetical protein
MTDMRPLFQSTGIPKLLRSHNVCGGPARQLVAEELERAFDGVDVVAIAWDEESDTLPKLVITLVDEHAETMFRLKHL